MIRGASAVEGFALIVAVVASAALSAGCESTTMSARRTTVPVLVGPVACIGCGPSAVPPGQDWLTDTSKYTYTLASGGNVAAWEKETHYRALARKVEAVAGKRCRGEIRVTRLGASTFGVFALVVAVYQVEIDVEGVPVSLPAGSCPPPALDAGTMRDSVEGPE